MHLTDIRNRDSRQCRLITALFEGVVSEQPDKAALVSRRGTLDYSGLNQRANQLAHRLRSHSIGENCVLAVALKRGIEYVVAMLASWKIGATYLPLDQSLPAKRMRYMMSDSGTSCLLTVKEILEEKSLNLEDGTIICLDDEDFIDGLKACPSANVVSVADRDDVAYIIYTSGTTGNPKGVAITHGSVFNLVDDVQVSREIEPSDRVLLFSSFCFDASIRDTTGALMLGASLYVPEEEETLPGNLVKAIAQHGITNSVITPSVLRACKLEHLPDLKTIVLAGETCDESLIRDWGAGRKLINAYGPTEATVCSAKQVYFNGQISPGCSASTIGRPVLNTTICILDENDILVKHGEVGEICVTGPGVSRYGYLNMPKLNAERFRDGYGSFCQCRSYKTGDLGRILPEGDIECLGRRASTRQVKLNGQRIELQKIENVIRSTQLVIDVAVLLQEHTPTRSLCAYVVPAQESSKFNQQEFTARLNELMRESLPSYSIPSIINVINALPLSANKKLDVKALLNSMSMSDNYTQSLPDTLTPLEEKIAIALLEALGLPNEQAVAPGTTYGELGGSSLQASWVLNHLNASLGCKIQIGQFYRSNVSLRQLADLISGEQQRQASPQPHDLQQQTRLPRDIVYNICTHETGKRKHTLLTGSTGFLGSHLLSEILSTASTKVSCIVRASSNRTARHRLKTALQSWKLWKDSFDSRIDIFCGDICKPFLGLRVDEYLHLAREVDTIYHSAAAVSFIASFAELEETSVIGTVEVLRFASTLRQKRLTYVSTLAVFFGADDETHCGMELAVNDLQTGIVTGYAQSKWVSEQLVLRYAQLGGHVLILRPGRLLGATHNYKCPRDDFTVRLIASILGTGIAPNFDDVGGKGWQVDLTPVDFCARAAHRLSLREETGIRHIINNNTMPYEDIVSSLGVHIRRVPYRAWLPLVAQSKHLAPLSSLFHEPVSSQDDRSVFEVLLQMEMFRNSSYASAVLEDDASQLPSTMQLLNGYLKANADIFSVAGDGIMTDRYTNSFPQ